MFFQMLKNWQKRRRIIRLYQSINGAKVAKAERERLGLNDFAFTYGEVVLPSFLEILKQAHPQQGEKFVDLGSGTGKSVIIAAMFYEFGMAQGIELLPGLHKIAEEVKAKLPQLSCHLDFKLGDIFTTDFSDADVVFVNATGFFGDTLEKLFAKLAQLKPGSRVILSTKKVQLKAFEEIYCNFHLMSWGMSRITIYQVSK